MNLILLDSEGNKQKLEKSDRRAIHIRKVIPEEKWSKLWVGIVNGPTGYAQASLDEAFNVNLEIEWDAEIPCLRRSYPLTVLIGLSRPQTCRKILRDAASFGVRRLIFFRSDKGEPSYRNSRLWSTEEWEVLLKEGLEQACHTQLPEVTHFEDLDQTIASLGAEKEVRVAFDCYQKNIEPDEAWGSVDCSHVAAIGPERGWSDRERSLLTRNDFGMTILGATVLRTEVAFSAVCSVLSIKNHWW